MDSEALGLGHAWNLEQGLLLLIGVLKGTPNRTKPWDALQMPVAPQRNTDPFVTTRTVGVPQASQLACGLGYSSCGNRQSVTFFFAVAHACFSKVVSLAWKHLGKFGSDSGESKGGLKS